MCVNTTVCGGSQGYSRLSPKHPHHMFCSLQFVDAKEIVQGHGQIVFSDYKPKYFSRRDEIAKIM